MIKFLHLLSVIVFCTVQLTEGSIYDELKNYYNSDTNQEYNEEWKIFRKGFENEIAANIRENFGTTAVNIYEPGRQAAHLLARGFHLTDGVVMVYFYEMVLRELPRLLRPKLQMDLTSNFMNVESKLGRMFIDTSYYVARNSSVIVYARPEDQKFLSPFSLQQVDTIGKLVIVAEDCLLSGIAISTLSGDSVSLGHNSFRITDCKLMVEISTPNSGAPPVISPYFPPGPKELLEMILARPIRDELQIKLQGAMYSYINTSVIFEQPAVYRNNQQKLFKSYFGFMTDYVADLNRNTIKQNKAHVPLPNYEVTMNTETAQTRLRCHVTLKDVVLYGLDTAYATRAGGPYNDGSTQTVADAIVFSSMQIRGKITHADENGTSTKDFATELTDVTVVLVILIEEEKPKLLQIRFTGWRSLEFSIIPRQTSNQDRHEHQSLVYGYILNDLPVRVLNHVTSIIGHGPIDGNKEDNGDASGDNGGGNGGGGDNRGGDDNDGDNAGGTGGGEDRNRSGEINDSPTAKLNNKAKGFFSDDVLDDNFFSDDGLDKNFFKDDLDKNFFKDDLDKNFFKDDLDKNFFNDSKETTPNEGEFTNIDDDDGNGEKGSAVTGSGNKDNNMDGDDGEDAGVVSNGKDDDENNTAGDVDISNAPDGEQTNGDVDDQIEENEKESADAEVQDKLHLEQVNEDENKPAVGDEEPVNEKFIDKNLESDFFSDDFIKTDFFSDDDFDPNFESKEQGDSNGNKNNESNDKDPIDNADNEVDKNVPGDNEEQVDNDDKNINGNNEDDVEGNDDDDKDQIDNADNSNDGPDGNASNGNQVNEDDENIKGNYEDDEKYESGNGNHSPEKENNVEEANTKRPAPNGAFDDDKPFFSDDVLETDFFSDENVKGHKKTMKDTLDKDFFSDENTTGAKKTLNNKKNEGDNDGLEDGDGGNDKDNVNKDKKNLWVFASDENKKDMKLSGEGFFSDMEFELDSAEESRRHLLQDKNSANEQNPKNREGDLSDVDQKRDNLTIPIEEKHTSKENVTVNVEDSGEGKQNVLPSNVHNTRRRQNVHTSENEIR